MPARLGQNFLVDKNIAKKIVNSAGILPTETVIEIGPGKGILTDELSEKCRRIIAVEIDKKLSENLRNKYANRKNINIINADFMKWPVPKNRKFNFISNLPYYVSSAVIAKILRCDNWETAVFMVQKEVANRLRAAENSADYGMLSVACRVYCTAEKLFDVPNTCFSPRPEVTSTVVKLKRLTTPAVRKKDEKNFFGIVKSVFLHRRKTILNSLGMELKIDKKVLEKKIAESGLRPSCRAETVSINDFVKLAKILS